MAQGFVCIASPHGRDIQESNRWALCLPAQCRSNRGRSKAPVWPKFGLQRCIYMQSAELVFLGLTFSLPISGTAARKAALPNCSEGHCSIQLFISAVPSSPSSFPLAVKVPQPSIFNRGGTSCAVSAFFPSESA